ncbi:MAG TPA: ABC transporter ATP-binding protein [Bordetella sp.]|nr:ABC transporter ATP-binding protein [Bordetella sp.]
MHYGQHRALDGIDLELHAGECVALAGHNGAGKSTLIKLVLGLIRPTHGQVLLLGQDAASRQAAHLRHDIGYLPETVALYPAMTGAETLDFYARLKRQPLARNAVLLERVGIADAARRRVGGYSKGMRQRLALAQALLGQPRILLLDEPTTGLDPASRLMFYEIVRELRSDGATVLLSTHALAEIANHVDRVIVMKHGHKVADGTLAQLRQSIGVPVRIVLTLAQPVPATALPTPWEPMGPTRFERLCAEAGKVSVIRELGRMGLPLADIDIHTPSLDEIYAHLLERKNA